MSSFFPTISAVFFILCLCPASGHAVITRLTPLKVVIDESDRVAVATVEAIDPARPSMTLTFGDAIKGDAPSRTMPVLLKGDSEGNPKQVLDRVKVGAPVVVFITELPDRHMALAYCDGSWFQIIGQLVDGSPRWAFTHGEPYLRRTFKGTTDEMTQAVTAYVKEGKAPPAENPTEKPGLGPTLPGVIEPNPATTSGEAAKDAKATTSSVDVKDAKGTAPSPIAPPVPTNAPNAGSPNNESLKPWLLAAGAAAALVVLVLLLRKKGG